MILSSEQIGCQVHERDPENAREINNPLGITTLQSSQIFSDLPAELIHIILCYYTHSFKDLIKFSTINKTCKQISDHSLLWLEVRLMFYPPNQFLLLTKPQYFHNIPTSPKESYYSAIDTNITQYFLSTIDKNIFSQETTFPPVYRVSVKPFQPQHSQTTPETDQELAYRIGQWWMNLFVQYQRLFHSHIIHLQYSLIIYAFCHKIWNYFHFMIFFTECIGIVSIYLLFDCNSTNLSLENKVGFYILLGLIGIFIALTVIYMIDCFAWSIVYNKDTLRLRFNYSAIVGSDMVLVALISILISFCLVLAKCVGSVDSSYDWWMTVLPLWFGSCLSYGLFYWFHQSRSESFGLLIKLLASYIAITPPLTCTLVACYYDNIYTGPFQYTLIPLYPIFLSLFVWILFRIIYSCIFVLGESPIVYDYYTFIAALHFTNIISFLSGWSAVMLLIDSYRIDDNDWDKGFVSVHFNPLTCFLIFLFCCPCIACGFLLECGIFYGQRR